MYPSKLKQYIEDRNRKLNSEEINYVTNVNFHPQLKHISYNPWDNSYDMWDNLGNHYNFMVNN